MKKVKCKSCGASITFVQSPDNPEKQIPLDAKEVTAYEVEEHTFIDKQQIIVTKHRVHLSHFVTCPDANSFSKRPS